MIREKTVVISGIRDNQWKRYKRQWRWWERQCRRQIWRWWCSRIPIKKNDEDDSFLFFISTHSEIARLTTELRHQPKKKKEEKSLNRLVCSSEGYCCHTPQNSDLSGEKPNFPFRKNIIITNFYSDAGVYNPGRTYSFPVLSFLASKPSEFRQCAVHSLDHCFHSPRGGSVK